jgi:hypothetical protein
MDNISRFRSTDLLARRTITVDVPEFLVRALECRLAEANDGASEEESVELQHLIEIRLAEGLTLADIARLEPQVTRHRRSGFEVAGRNRLTAHSPKLPVATLRRVCYSFSP